MTKPPVEKRSICEAGGAPKMRSTGAQAMTPDEIRAICEAATREGWVVDSFGNVCIGMKPLFKRTGATVADATFIATARTELPRLPDALERVAKLEEEKAELQAEHAFDRQNWMGEIQSLRQHIQEHEIPPELEVQRLRSALATIAGVQFHSIGADGQLRVMKEIARNALVAGHRARAALGEP